MVKKEVVEKITKPAPIKKVVLPDIDPILIIEEKPIKTIKPGPAQLAVNPRVSTGADFKDGVQRGAPIYERPVQIQSTTAKNLKARAML